MRLFKASNFGSRDVHTAERTRRRGFTVVELLVAMGILSVSLAVIYEQFMRSNDSARERLIRDQAQLFAQEELETLQVYSYDSLKSWQGGETFVRVEGSTQYFKRSEIEVLEDGTLEIECTVAWGDRDETGQVFEPGNSISRKGVRAK